MGCNYELIITVISVFSPPSPLNPSSVTPILQICFENRKKSLDAQSSIIQISGLYQEI